MAAYVLVGGAWLGGWCWKRVARRLRVEGLDAYPVTLTEVGRVGLSHTCWSTGLAHVYPFSDSFVEHGN
jgi:hypothetical protein